MKKSERQKILLKIIEENEFDTQNDLVDKLNLLGLNATQATISRDIKDLNIVKTSGKTKKYRYAVNFDNSAENSVYKNAVVSIKLAQNLIVVKTQEGNANAVASFIDKQLMEDVLGTLAGDDNLLIITENNEKAWGVKQKLDEIFL